MAQFTVKYGDISPRVGIKAEAKLLAVGQPLLISQRFAQVDGIGTRSGNTIKWRRYLPFSVSTAPLAEGVPPSVQPMSKTDYTAVLQQYGAVVELTDVCYDLHEDNPLDVAVTRCGEQMAQTIELLTIDVLKSGTNVYYGSGVASRGAVTNPPTRADFRLIARGFDRNDAQPITKVVSPSALTSTMGIEPAFIAMAHTDLEPDIRNMTGFKTTVEYGGPGAKLPGEVGAVERFRFILTRMFTPWASVGASVATMLAGGVKPSGAASCDVYPIICIARDAYGVVRLQGLKAVEVKVRQPNQNPDSGDPLAQRGTVGWKTYYAAALLNEQWIARLEVSCTATPN